jgi:hypothetical protein
MKINYPIQQLILIVPYVLYHYLNDLAIYLQTAILIVKWDFNTKLIDMIVDIFFFLLNRILFKEQWYGKIWIVQVSLLFLKYLLCPMFGFRDGLLKISILKLNLFWLGMIHFLKILYLQMYHHFYMKCLHLIVNNFLKSRYLNRMIPMIFCCFK